MSSDNCLRLVSLLFTALALISVSDLVDAKSTNWSDRFAAICDDLTQSLPAETDQPHLVKARNIAVEVRTIVCDSRPEKPGAALGGIYGYKMLDIMSTLEFLRSSSSSYKNGVDDPSLREQLIPEWEKLPLGHAPTVNDDCIDRNNYCELSISTFTPFEVDRDDCSIAVGPDMSCREFLREFEKIYTYAHGSLATIQATRYADYMTELDREWTEFAEESKSQHPIELAVNGFLFRRHKEAYRFERPPSMQFVLMHPGVALEYVDKADDGSQTEWTPMLEWVGVDFWRQDKWYLPSGGSIISVYSDRAGTEDFGHGISLNFHSKYTVGITDRRGDVGFFLTVDLLKLIQDNAETIRQYR